MDSNQAAQLSRLHARLDEIDAVFYGTAPRIDTDVARTDGNKVTLRTALWRIIIKLDEIEAKVDALEAGGA